MMNPLIKFVHMGVTDQDDYFDRRLKKAINILTLNAIIMISLAALFGHFIQKNAEGIYIIFSLPVFFLVLYLNWKSKILTAITLMFVFCALLLAFYSLRTGEESYTHIHFTLNIIGVALLYRKNKVRPYLYVNLIFTLLVVVFVFIAFNMHWFDWLLDKTIIPHEQRRLNFIVLTIGSIVFSLVVVNAHAQQNKEMINSLEEQKVLLAEVNHRVKNNMAVIVSLINLKKNLSENEETVGALSDIKEQVMSMALIHKMVYEDKNKRAVDIKSYIEELCQEIKNSFPPVPDVEFKIDVQTATMDISKAIPFGLILNELITNSMKHAFKEISSPRVEIKLRLEEADTINVVFRDNGIGLNLDYVENDDKLGMMLIRSLGEQIDSKFSFRNENGLVFEISIPSGKQ